MTEAPVVRGELLAWGRRALTGLVPDPGREAAWLWRAATGESRTRTVLDYDHQVGEDAARNFAGLIARRVRGEPLAYVTGETEFRTLTIGCDRRALIPRPETEGLVELVLSRRATGTAVDVGTGTGCIALSLAVEGSYARVVALDRSAEALALARMNVRRLGVRVDLFQGDLVAPLRTGSVDVLVSNPPYLTESEYASCDPSVRDWEPALALASGPEGMDALRRLFYEGQRVVRPGGLLALEVDATRASDSARLAAAAGWIGVELREDLFGRSRYLVAHRGEET